MAKLAAFEVEQYGANYEPLKFSFPVKVDSKGKFIIRITPENPCGQELIDYFRLDATKKRIEEAGLLVYQGRKSKYGDMINETWLEGDTLKNLKIYLNTELESYFTMDKVIDYVIAYKFDCNLFYWKSAADGKVYPDKPRGHEGEEGEWVGERTSRYHDISLAAQCFQRTTYKRGDYKSERYSFVERSDRDTPVGKYGFLLNDWQGGIISPKDLGRNRYPDGAEGIIAYSEQAAQFFYELIYAFASASDKMRREFADEQSTLKFISQVTSGTIENIIPIPPECKEERGN